MTWRPFWGAPINPKPLVFSVSMACDLHTMRARLEFFRLRCLVLKVFSVFLSCDLYELCKRLEFFKFFILGLNILGVFVM